MSTLKMRSLINSRTKIRWWAYFTILSITIAVISCDKVNDNDNKESHPYLKIVNQNTDNRIIKAVSLVGYEFKDLNINVDNSQTFNLDMGMPGGLKDINVNVSFTHGWSTASINKIVSFDNGKITTIHFKGCVSAEGCTGFYLE